MTRLFNITDDNFKRFTFGKMAKIDDRYFIPMAFKENEDSSSEPILIQINKAHALENLTTENGIVKNFELSVNSNTKDILSEFDDQILSITKEHSKEWFPDKAEHLTSTFFDNAILNSYKSIKNKKTYKFSARTTKNINVFNSQHEELEVKDVIEDTSVNMIVQAYGIWFTRTRIGITWRIHQIKVNTPRKPTTECLFEDDDGEDLENVFPDDEIP